MNIPGFVLGERIGAGSHGVVYRATSTGVGRPAAIKVIVDPGDLARRFQREIAALARLSWHPHIVQVFDGGVLEDGTLWAAMELLGAPLSQAGAVANERVADIGIQIASALAVAHDVAIIHRDVKPANILSASGGLVKLSDFGIAADLAGDASTLSGLLGTLQYLAPEVFDGAAADERSDQYSLAVTLCALAIGGSPFPSAPGGQGIGALMRAKSSSNDERLIAAGVAGALLNAVTKGMHPDPAKRFASVEEFAQALGNAQVEQRWAVTRYVGPPVEPSLPVDRPPVAPTVLVSAPVAPSSVPARAPVAPVAATVLGSPTPAFAAPTPSTPSSAPAAHATTEASRPRRRMLAAIAAVVILLAGAVAAFALLGGEDSENNSSFSLNAPVSLAIAADGSLYIADDSNHRIIRVDPEAGPAVFAGTAGDGSGEPGRAALETSLDAPTGVAVGEDVLYIADAQAHRILAVDADGIVSNLAGPGDGSLEAGQDGDGGLAIDATLGLPSRLAVGRDGTIFFTDGETSRVRALNVDGTIGTFAGSHEPGFGGDSGPAVDALLRWPGGMAVDDAGVVYIADTGNHRIRAVALDGTISTIAGTGTEGFSGDRGKAVDADLGSPNDVAIGPDGSIYIADSSNNRIRVIDADGVITTIAGIDTGGYSGDGSDATAAELDNPVAVAVHTDGTVYITDGENNCIRVISPDRKISTLVG